ncbi:MAG: extracellular solute-binding protein [Alphaproteobacteria bacterium]
MVDLIVTRRLLTLLAAGLVAGAIGALPLLAEAEEVTVASAIAEFGEPLYKDGFDHWPYANPDAPKGGKIVLDAPGSFDSLNTIILKGDWPTSIGLISDSLMVPSADELSVVYGLIAETAEYPADKSWIIFNLRPEARYQDGEPITAEDFVFRFETTQEIGRPFLKSFYEDVEGVEALSDHKLKFTFKTRDNMKPLLKVAELSPLPRHYWKERDITKTTLEPPLGSGAYELAEVDPGRSLTYRRVADYWAADLPVNRGLNNFDEIRYDYYREPEVAFEAFKAGDIDFRQENSSKRWATGYDVDAAKSGRMAIEEIPNEVPEGIQAYFINNRLAKFSDPRVRQALGYLYDFEAIQRTLLYGQYQRTESYFPNSDFGVSGPPTPEEIAILEPYRDRLPPELFEKAFELPKTDGSGRNRAQFREAVRLFEEAGWTLVNGKLTHGDSGEVMTIEFLILSPDQERLTAPFVKNLRHAGIDATIRTVDSSQYQVRLDDFDYDMTTVKLNFFPPPGPELRSYYGSEAADVRGSANMAGIKNPVADELIEQIIAAKDLDTLKATNRALDRVLLWNYYVLPQFHNDIYRVAYWNKFGKPETNPRYGLSFPGAWWIDTKLEQQASR